MFDASVARLRAERPAGALTGQPTSRGVRLAVIVFGIRNFLQSWYWREVITGIDARAEHHVLSLELIGDPGSDLDSIRQRLLNTRPDAIA